MAFVDFTGHDVVVWFDENPLNEQEWAYRIRYECADTQVVHYVVHNEQQSTKDDGMRAYKDVLTFEENRAAGLTRSPKIYLSTQLAGQDDWSDELLIEALNPAPAALLPKWMPGPEFVQFDCDKPIDADWAGFVIWCDTVNPPRKTETTSKYQGPNNSIQIALAEDTQYYVTFAAYDAFGTDLLNEVTFELRTPTKASILLPIINERVEKAEALIFKSSDALTKLGNAFDLKHGRDILLAEERLGTKIDEQTGEITAFYVRELAAAKDGLYAAIDLEEQARVSADEAVASSVRTLTTAVETDRGTFTSALQTESLARSTKDEALATEITRMGAKLTTDMGVAINTAIVAERTVRISADNALTLVLNQQASKIADNEAQFSDQIETLVNADAALSTRITGQAAQWQSYTNGVVTAAQQSLNQTIANGDSALSQRIDQLSAQMGDDDGWVAAIQEVRRAYADADSAITENIATLTSGYGGRFSSIEQNMSTQGNAIDGFRSAYTLRIDDNGRVSGFGLISQNGNSEFAINADRFLIAAPGYAEAVFEVVSGQVRIKQAIIDRMVVNQASIGFAQIDTLQIRGGAVTIKHVLTAGDIYVAANTAVNCFETGWLPVGDGSFGTASVDVEFTLDGTVAYDTACRFFLFIDTGSGYVQTKSKTLGVSTDSGNTYFRMDGSLSDIVSGQQVRIILRANPAAWLPRSVARNVWVRDIGIAVDGAKR